jgi:hypothetical protein
LTWSDPEVREKFRRQRRQIRVVTVVLLAAAFAAIGVHISDVLGRPTPKRPFVIATTTTSQLKPIQSFTDYQAQQYGKQCGNYSPSNVDLDYWYGTEYSCAPTWLKGVKTFAQMEDQWYGRACGNYSPTRELLIAFNNARFHCPGHITKFLPSFEN